jgi:hypothetical protein
MIGAARYADEPTANDIRTGNSKYYFLRKFVVLENGSAGSPVTLQTQEN